MNYKLKLTDNNNKDNTLKMVSTEKQLKQIQIAQMEIGFVIHIKGLTNEKMKYLDIQKYNSFKENC